MSASVRPHPPAPLPSLFVVEADDPAGLAEGLDALAGTLKAGADVPGLARAWWSARPGGPSKRLGVAVHGDDLPALAGAVADDDGTAPEGPGLPLTFLDQKGGGTSSVAPHDAPEPLPALIADGTPVCITVTHLLGLKYARSLFDSSMSTARSSSSELVLL